MTQANSQLSNSAATPVIEYCVETECGRIFSWSATSLSDLAYDFKIRTGLNISIATPYTEYEAEQAAIDAQEEYIYELQNSAGHYQSLPKGA